MNALKDCCDTPQVKDLTQGLGPDRHYYCAHCKSHLWKGEIYTKKEWEWFITRVMTKKQAVQYAVFAAEQVIDIYERKYPDDQRPRKAIEAAKEYLKSPSIKNKKAAAAGAADAAYGAAGAAAAGYAYSAYERRKMKAKILKYGIGLLEQS